MVDPDLLIHPGEILRDEFLTPYGLAPSAFAERLGMPANRITRLVNGETGVSREMAILLGTAFGTTPEFWLNLQARYDLDTGMENVPPAALERARKLHEELMAA